MRRSLAIIIPMYNEESNAERCVRTVCQVLAARVPAATLFAVNDGSQDRTGEILDSLQGQLAALTVVTYSTNRGYGGAILAGVTAAREAGHEFGLVMDSDLTNDPLLIPQFADKLASGEFDLVKASRYIRGGGMRGVPLYRQLFTRVGNRIAALLFRMGIRDCTNGFHAVRLSLVSNCKFRERGFPFLLEELYHLKRQGARATEIPYILTSRGCGASKFSYRPSVLWSYLRYALSASFLPSGRRF